MSTRIGKDGKRTRPHRCGRNCPQDHVHSTTKTTRLQVDDDADGSRREAERADK